MDIGTREKLSYIRKLLKYSIKLTRYLRRIKPDYGMTNTVVFPHLAISCKMLGIKHCWFIHEIPITRAAIILLGKYESAFKLRPAVVQVTWTRRDEKQDVVDYEHFTVPFILTVDEILSKIENLTMREMPGGTLFPDTMKQYDDYTIREALHNCIAHQDYTMQQRINFVENPTYLYYSNAGSFIPGTLENALTNEEPQAYFRNECLCRAMVDFNMIDTVSRGIKKMFNEQWRRHFPMPDYEIDAKNRKVSVRIYGAASVSTVSRRTKPTNCWRLSRTC